MDKSKLAKKVKEIEMPKDMEQRIIKNCYMEMEKRNMSKHKKIFKKPMVVAASFVLCVCLTGVTALAATGKLEGFFKDIKRWDGAVIGTSYEQATDEVELKVIDANDKLVVEITMLKSSIAPYSVFELFGIEKYKIIDTNGNVVVENESLEMSKITDNKVVVSIPLENVNGGEYTLVVDEFVGSSKADQPLVLSGTWRCDFIR